MRKTKKKTTSIEFSEEMIQEIIKGLFDFLNEKPDNIFINDFLILQKKLRNSDIEVLATINEDFRIAIDDAKKIEETKLKKYASADRLNASFVKEILNRDHH